MSVGQGNVDQTMKQGNIIYGKAPDGHFYPMQANSAGEVKLQQREYFIFYPGYAALASGGVLSGTRSGAVTTTSGTVAASTYWASWATYAPLRSGKIDGLTSGGVISGQLTVGTKVGAGTGVVKITAEIANTANTGSPTTMLALSGTITCTTAEVYTTFDVPHLACDTVMNAVPFAVRAGVQHSQGGSTMIFRIMESSYVDGYFEPGT